MSFRERDIPGPHVRSLILRLAQDEEDSEHYAYWARRISAGATKFHCRRPPGGGGQLSEPVGRRPLTWWPRSPETTTPRLGTGALSSASGAGVLQSRQLVLDPELFPLHRRDGVIVGAGAVVLFLDRALKVRVLGPESGSPFVGCQFAPPFAAIQLRNDDFNITRPAGDFECSLGQLRQNDYVPVSPKPWHSAPIRAGARVGKAAWSTVSKDLRSSSVASYPATAK